VLGFVPCVYGSTVPITYETQSRSVSANSSATGFSRAGTSLAPMTDQQSQSQMANGLGDFNGNVGVTSTLGPGNTMATGSAVQQSSLTASAFSATGAVRADSTLGTGAGPANSSASTVFHVTFDVQQAESYAFSANLNGSLDPVAPGNTSASIQLMDAAGDNLFAPISTVNLLNFQSQGTLAAGVYSLILDAQATSDDQNSNFVNYSVALSAGGDPTLLGAEVAQNPGTASVPLPPAASATLLMLAGLGVVSYVRRRYSGWVRFSLM
jgi:hypothetical protein